MPDAVPSNEAWTARRRIFEEAADGGPDAVARALNSVRERKGLSYGQLSRMVGSAGKTTIQNWLTAVSVPQAGNRESFDKLLDGLDVVDPPGALGGIGHDGWWNALRPGRNGWAGGSGVESPYPGVRPFDLATARFFPGRAEAVDGLRARIRRRLDGEERPLLLVTGRSGIGKSSLVAAAVAGLGAGDQAPVIVTPSPSAVAAVASVRAAEQAAPTVLVLDQAESLWSADGDDERAEILRAVAEIQEHREQVAVVMVLRSDAIEPASDNATLRAALEHAHFVVGPISRDDARQIIVGPTGDGGITVDPGLVDVILKDAGADPALSDRAAVDALVGALPLLSQTMRSLWEQRTAADRITLADYARVGGVTTSIQAAGDAAYERLSEEAKKVWWPVLREMIRVESDGVARRTAPYERFTDPASIEVISTLRDAHLLMSDGDGVTIGHEYLLTAWPRLAERLESVQNWSDARRQLAQYSSLWEETGRPADMLGTEPALNALAAKQNATDGDGQDEGDLTGSEREFLAAVKEARDRQLHESRRENTRLRRQTRRLRIWTVTASALLAIAIVAAATAGSIMASLNAARTAATVADTADQARDIEATLPSQAAQLAIAGYSMQDTPQTRSTLLSLTAAAHPRRLVGAAGPGTLAAADNVIVEGGTNHTIKLLDPQTGQVLQTIKAPSSHTYALDVVDAGGQRLLAASGEDASEGSGQGCVWDISNISEEPGLLGCVETPSKSDSATILPDGSGALFGGADGTIQRLGIDDGRASDLGQIPGPQRDDEPPAPVVGLDAAGSTVIAAGNDGTLATLTDPLGQARWSRSLDVSPALSVRVSADGERFAVPTTEGSVTLGRVRGNGRLTVTGTATGFESWVNHVEFLPEGGIAAVSSDQTLRFFTSDGGAPTHTRVLASIPTAVVVTDTIVATYEVGGVTMFWPRESFPDPDERGRVFAVETDAAGSRIIATVGAKDGLLHVDRIEADGSRTALEVPDTGIATPYGVDVSADGEFVASAGSGHLQIWRVDDTALSRPTSIEVAPGDSNIISATYSPDGTRIVMFDLAEPSLIVYDITPDPADDGAGVRLTPHSKIPVNAGYVAFTDNDTLLVTDEDNVVTDDDEVTWRLLLWDLSADREIGSIPMGDQHTVALAARPHHPGQVAFATESREAGILDITDPAHPHELSRVTQLTDAPRDIAFDSTGTRIVIATASSVDVRAASRDGREISETELRLVGPLRTQIADAAFLDNDSRMVASTYSGHLWWWDLHPERAITTICSSIGTPLTITEAQALAPAIPDGTRIC
ncbi:WD40 repeat domain-containing protein [Myceligenerans pegani]|uniref:Novel STAND NTPase 1 domain-containing protein n=1 Tax=Myceligenerans pegani TaxID=2776917 RepID=A0ABR9MYX5_9MICO|nr:WD40 repeat domain-containing protein [Myceligenerans sp. TRM 65318]MBE1876599.1 hypothetical protein [Myceligenerans sp. TRM 65318]MBE3018870.1 hypothetical protein [Myceligenerans sp. TRM 65318]